MAPARLQPIAVTSDVTIRFNPRADTTSLLRVSVNDQLGQVEDTAELTLNLHDESIPTDEHPLVLVEDTLHELGLIIILADLDEYEILSIDKFGRSDTPHEEGAGDSNEDSDMDTSNWTSSSATVEAGHSRFRLAGRKVGSVTERELRACDCDSAPPPAIPQPRCCRGMETAADWIPPPSWFARRSPRT